MADEDRRVVYPLAGGGYVVVHPNGDRSLVNTYPSVVGGSVSNEVSRLHGLAEGLRCSQPKCTACGGHGLIGLVSTPCAHCGGHGTEPRPRERAAVPGQLTYEDAEGRVSVAVSADDTVTDMLLRMREAMRVRKR